MKLSAVAALLLSAQALAAPQFVSQYEDDAKSLSGSDRRGQGTIFERIRQDKRFSRFVEVLEKNGRGLKDDLEDSKKTTTIFVPDNEAMKRIEKEWELSSDKESQLRDVIKYHIAPDAEVSRDCMHAGALVPTDLRLKSLGDRHQRIKISKFANTVFLNMEATVTDSERADNGYIHAISQVLIPPRGIAEQALVAPTLLSTSLLALTRVGLACDVNDRKTTTVFLPSNSAWKSLGFQNVAYLFSCVGQKTEDRGNDNDSDKNKQPWCAGTRDLEKIVRFHVTKNDLAYSTDILKNKKMEFQTLEGQKIDVQARRRTEQGSFWKSDEHRDVRDFDLIVNQGEARVMVADNVAKNGAVHVINNVLVPKSVRLPHNRGMMMAE